MSPVPRGTDLCVRDERGDTRWTWSPEQWSRIEHLARQQRQERARATGGCMIGGTDLLNWASGIRSLEQELRTWAQRAMRPEWVRVGGRPALKASYMRHIGG